MAAMDIRQALDAALENRKLMARTILPDDPKARRRLIWSFVLLASTMGFEAFQTLSVNTSLARTMSDPLAAAIYTRTAAWLWAAQTGLGMALVLAIPFLAKYLFVLFGYLYLPVDAAVTWLASRREGYREFPGAYREFMEPQLVWPFQLVLWFVTGTWFFPRIMLWPAGQLGLSPDAYLASSLCLVGLIGVGVLWFNLNKALDKMDGEASTKAKARVAAWLGNPAGLKDFLDAPLMLAACVLFFGFLVWPALNHSLEQVKTGVADVLVEELDYEANIEYWRQNLLLVLESRGKGGERARKAILPEAAKVRDSLLFQLPDYRAQRDRTLPLLIPLGIVMAAALLGVRKLIHLRAAQGAGGARQASRAGGLPWQGA